MARVPEANPEDREGRTPGPFRRRAAAALRAGPVILALLVCNGVLFRRHYAGTSTFPFDFTGTYLAVPHYWLAQLMAGQWPSWVAHQGFGYPLAANLQSGLFYPPFWLVALLRLPYSAEVATILQCLHVLLGAAGMAWLVHRKTGSRGLAAIGGVAFQLLGPALGNAQHPDIVRGYAFCPWMLLALDDVGPHGRPGTLGVGASATVLAFGGPLSALVRVLLPPLQLSRFPSADYRGWITVVVLLAGVVGIARLLESRGGNDSHSCACALRRWQAPSP